MHENAEGPPIPDRKAIWKANVILWCFIVLGAVAFFGWWSDSQTAEQVRVVCQATMRQFAYSLYNLADAAKDSDYATYEQAHVYSSSYLDILNRCPRSAQDDQLLSLLDRVISSTGFRDCCGCCGGFWENTTAPQTLGNALIDVRGYLLAQETQAAIDRLTRLVIDLDAMGFTIEP